MFIISAIGLLCCDKFEGTPNEKVINMSNLTKPYFTVVRIEAMDDALDGFKDLTDKCCSDGL